MSMQLPSSSQIQFTDEAIRKAAEGPKLPFGPHLFKIVGCEAQVAESEKSMGNVVLKVKAAALKDPSDVNSTVRPLQYMTVTLPFDNPLVQGHTAPEWASGIAARFFRSIDEDLPRPPRRDPETGLYMYQGEVVVGDAIEGCRADALKAVYVAAQEALADPTTLVGLAFYGMVGEKNGYKGIQTTWSELPEDLELTDLSDAKVSAPKA